MSKSKKVYIHIVQEEIKTCPVCKRRLLKAIVPKTEGILAGFCSRCHIYYTERNMQLTKQNGFSIMSEQSLRRFKRTHDNIEKIPSTKHYPITDNTLSEKGKKGYCIKCGEKVYNGEMYCFECFKNQRNE